MTVRQVVATYNFPRVRVGASPATNGNWVEVGRIRPSQTLGGARHVAIVHGKVGSYVSSGSLVKTDVEVRVRTFQPGTSDRIHLMTFGDFPGSPYGLVTGPAGTATREQHWGFPFHVVTRSLSIEPIIVSVRLTNFGQADAQSFVYVEDVTVTVFALDELDASDVSYTYSEGFSGVGVGLSNSLVAAAPSLPRTTGDGDEYALFWSVEVQPRRSTSSLPTPPPQPFSFHAAWAVRVNPPSTIAEQWGARGYKERTTPRVVGTTRHWTGGMWVHDFSAHTSHTFGIALQELDQTGQGVTTPHRWAMFSLELRNLGARFVESSASAIRLYGAPESLRDRPPGQVLSLEFDGDQDRHLAAFWDGVPQSLLRNDHPLSFGSKLRYAFSADSRLPSSAEPRLYALHQWRDDRPWDCESTNAAQIRGGNSVQVIGQWNPQDFDYLPSGAVEYFTDRAGGPDLHGLRFGQLLLIERFTGISPYVEPNPQLGPDVYIVPGAEAPDVSELPQLAADPVEPLQFSAVVGRVDFRADDGTLVTWPKWIKPTRQVVMPFVFDAATQDAERIALLTQIRTAPGAAFQWRGRPYVFDRSTLTERVLDRRVAEITVSAYQLRYTEDP